MKATILQHPATIAHQLRVARLCWMEEAARFHAKGDEVNARYCQGRAAGLDDAIVMMGGEAISLRISDYANTVENEAEHHGFQGMEP